jgi:hypothetical protein
MRAFTRLDGRAAPLELANIDTDQIIPKQFLKTVEREGLAKGLFYDFRFDGEGKRDQRLRAEPAGVQERSRADRRRQFRLRQLARARPVGADGLRDHVRDLDQLRRHLQQQLLQQRPAAGGGQPEDLSLS